MSLRTAFLARTAVRTYAARVSNYFEMFPKCFPAGGPPKDQFTINLRQLRREYRNLQSEHHPDIVMGSAALSSELAPHSDDTSALINRAYTTIRNPYARVAYVIQLQHPDHIDITRDEVLKQLISEFQSNSAEYSAEYKMLLMTVLEAHESLELANTEADLETLSSENEERIEDSQQKIEQLLGHDPVVWNDVIMEAIRLKYWVNIANGIKEWEPGKPVHLTH